jgi:hypothetical protein
MAELNIQQLTRKDFFHLNNTETLLDQAVRLKQTKAADLLRKHGGKTGEELKAATN